MARPRTAARRYAEAAFELATARGQAPDAADRWRDELDLAAGIVGDENVRRVLENPARPWPEREAVVSGLLGDRVSAPVFNLIRLLARRGRADLAGAVAAEFHRLLNRSREVATATVTSARELSDEELDAIRARVEELTGSAVEMTATVDPALIGGLTVRVGDRLIDASVRGRLERLRTRLAAGVA